MAIDIELKNKLKKILNGSSVKDVSKVWKDLQNVTGQIGIDSDTRQKEFQKLLKKSRVTVWRSFNNPHLLTDEDIFKVLFHLEVIDADGNLIEEIED